MRVALYLFAAVLLLPYFLLAAGLLLLGKAIGGGTLAAFLAALLSFALWLIPWGLLGLASAFITILALGANDRFRWIGSACLSLIAFASLLVIISITDAATDAGQLLFLLPCLIVTAFCAWLAATELREQRPPRGPAAQPTAGNSGV